jgi:hypothetical protein
MDRNNRAEAIVFAAEHHLQFLPLDLGPRRVKRRLGFARGVGILGALILRHREEQASLFERLLQPLEAAQLDLYPIVFLENRLRGFRAVPEAGLAGFFEQFLFTRAKFGGVKDASRGRRCGLRSRSIVRACRSALR